MSTPKRKGNKKTTTSSPVAHTEVAPPVEIADINLKGFIKKLNSKLPLGEEGESKRYSFKWLSKDHLIAIFVYVPDTHVPDDKKNPGYLDTLVNPEAIIVYNGGSTVVNAQGLKPSASSQNSLAQKYDSQIESILASHISQIYGDEFDIRRMYPFGGNVYSENDLTLDNIYKILQEHQPTQSVADINHAVDIKKFRDPFQSTAKNFDWKTSLNNISWKSRIFRPITVTSDGNVRLIKYNTAVNHYTNEVKEYEQPRVDNFVFDDLFADVSASTSTKGSNNTNRKSERQVFEDNLINHSNLLASTRKSILDSADSTVSDSVRKQFHNELKLEKIQHAKAIFKMIEQNMNRDLETTLQPILDNRASIINQFSMAKSLKEMELREMSNFLLKKKKEDDAAEQASLQDRLSNIDKEKQIQIDAVSKAHQAKLIELEAEYKRARQAAILEERQAIKSINSKSEANKHRIEKQIDIVQERPFVKPTELKQIESTLEALNADTQLRIDELTNTSEVVTNDIVQSWLQNIEDNLRSTDYWLLYVNTVDRIKDPKAKIAALANISVQQQVA
jgi:hypothetical protein